ncbi:MAG: hypothetical protein WC145_11525 [Aliarcobacter sp.]|jgi:hypothetical protein|nr:hypothetical protein [Bacteroidales bacterium]
MSVIKDWAKRVVGRWLNLVEAQDRSITVRMTSKHEINVMKNRIMYRGDPSELDQFFKATATDEVTAARFWASSPSKGMRIRKIHSGIPSMIIDVLADIVVADLLDVTFKADTQGIDELEVWEAMAEENRYKKLVTKAIQEVLVTGDGAFKLSIDTDLSPYPIIEFFGGERVDYKFNRGRVEEIQFLTRYEEKTKTYTLVERYGKGYVRYELLDKSGNEVALANVPELENLTPVEWEDDYMMAVPLMFYDSPLFEGRGKPLLDTKTDSIDALDETISQWQEALRQGRIKRYIPESMIPRNPQTGEPLPINPFDNQFTALADSMREGSESKIVTEQPTIQYQGYVNTYLNNLDMCLQGIVSPSSLGIDVKRMDNAEAQREKEKTTLYTRDKIITTLRQVLPVLVSSCLHAYATLHELTIGGDFEVSIDFGEYANPSFEAQVETIGKAAVSNIMSIEAQVEELWGDTKDDEWIEDEIRRIKAEKGIIELEEPTMVPHGFAEEVTES